MKFKVFDSDARKRKRLAAQALAEIRRLSDAKYPLALLFDKFAPNGLERKPGDSWPDVYARHLKLDVPQLRDFVRGLIDTGLYESNNEKPTENDLLSYFKGWSVLLLVCEQELSLPLPNGRNQHKDYNEE